MATKSGTSSEKKRRDEIRQEVEALVRLVVPRELENVDYMMEQFEGREQDLMATLRAMKEATAVSRNRMARLKAAQQERRRAAQSGGSPENIHGNETGNAADSEKASSG